MTRVVVEAQVDIKRSLEDAFDYSSDPSREPEWNPMMKRAVKLTEGPVGLGARCTTEFVQGPAMVIECIRYERPTTWAFTGDSRALKATSQGRVVPTSEGAHLVMRMELDPQGPLKLATPRLRGRMGSCSRRMCRTSRLGSKESMLLHPDDSERDHGGGQRRIGDSLGERLARSCRCATTRPACQPGARPAIGGLTASPPMPLRVNSQGISELEFQISPVLSSSQPQTGVEPGVPGRARVVTLLDRD
jgi:uncharacterized protein YndB with AHSA1/START domain